MLTLLLSAPHACDCGTVEYCQSMLVVCIKGANAGISRNVPPLGPASNTKTLFDSISPNRKATMLPAEPDPTKKHTNLCCFQTIMYIGTYLLYNHMHD